MSEDLINNPAHYVVGQYEAIDIIEAFDLNFRLANVVKYVLRCDRKGAPLSDLKKGMFYLAREIAKREESEKELRDYITKRTGESNE